MGYVFLSYDIPKHSEANRHAERFRARLHEIAVRINESDWLMRADDIPHNWLNDMRAWGASWNLTPEFPDSAIVALNAMAMNALAREVAQRLASLGESIDEATGQLLDASKKTPDERLKHFRSRTRKALRRSQQWLKTARATAEYLGFETGGVDLAGAAARMHSLQNAAHTRSMLYAQASAELVDPVARVAALNDELPLFAMFDALEEQGSDSGEALREAFAKAS